MTKQNPSPIKLDASPCSCVVTCSDHPWYSALANSREGGWDAAARHEELQHAGDYRVRNARQMRAARHAATAANV